MSIHNIMKNFIRHIVFNNQKTYYKILTSKAYKFIYMWILNNTKELQNKQRKYALKTFIYWILNDIKSFDDDRCKCDYCHTPFINKDVFTFVLGYYKYPWRNTKYCDKCRYFQSEDQSNKRINTWLKNYGTNHPCKNKDVIKRMGDHNEQVYGKGIRNVYQAEPIKCKIKQKNLDNYGFEYSGQFPHKIQKTKETNLRKRGYVTNLITPEQQEKNAQHNLKTYGTRRPPTWFYKYDSKSFDSAPELAYYIWLTDHNIQFKYQPDVDIQLYDNNGNKIGKYYPDFLLIESNQYVEIKGDQFFDKDGNPVNPYNHKSWKEKYDWIMSHNVLLLRTKDYKNFLDYCCQKFQCKKWYSIFKRSHR